jgi:hypothetical protein
MDEEPKPGGDVRKTDLIHYDRCSRIHISQFIHYEISLFMMTGLIGLVEATKRKFKLE